MSTATHNRSRRRDQYLELVMRFPPRPIRDEAHYDQTVRAMNTLAVRDEGSLSRAAADYLEALTRFVEDYDAKHFLPRRRTRTPLGTLKYLMKETDMSIADLGRLLNNSGLASQIIHGKRELSKAHIRLLADHFRVSPALFL